MREQLTGMYVCSLHSWVWSTYVLAKEHSDSQRWIYTDRTQSSHSNVVLVVEKWDFLAKIHY